MTRRRRPRRRCLSFILVAVLTLDSSAAALAQRPLNLDFEMRSVSYRDRPWGWTLGWSAFAGGPPATFALDDTVRIRGSRSLRITSTDVDSAAPARALTLQLPAAFARGQELRLTGVVRTRGLSGHAMLLLEAWRDRAIAAADTGMVRGGVGNDRWMPFDLTLRVPSDHDVHSVVISTAVQGAGSAWFDALELRVAGTSLSALPADPGPPTPAELSWLAARTAPLREVRALPAGQRDDGDLRLFSHIVGGARLVGLGESTHGTSEFFQVKHRLLEYLVRRHGFDVFAVEANQLAVERLNAYVLGGAGTARDAMRVMFRVWNTEEMLTLVEWIRGYNASRPPRQVKFIGYDMQDHRAPTDSLHTFVARTEPQFLSRVETLTREYRAERSYATPHVPEGTRALWYRRADTLWREVSLRRGRWLAAARRGSDSAAVEWAVHAADLLRQAARFNVSLSSPERDSLMAANLDWALRTLYPESRAVVWAHDVHISRGGDPARSFNGGAQMGAYLIRAYGHEYRAFSLLTRSGRYSATRSFSDHEIISVEAFPAPPGSVEAAFAALPRPSASVGVVADVRIAPDNPRGTWLWRPRPIRHVGYAAYDYGFELLAVLPLEFDGVIFIDRTGPSRLLP